MVPRKIRLRETWQLYSVKFWTVGPTRGEEGKNCTKASRGEKIKLTAQHSLLVNKCDDCYECVRSSSEWKEDNEKGWRIKQADAQTIKMWPAFTVLRNDLLLPDHSTCLPELSAWWKGTTSAVKKNSPERECAVFQ